MPELAEVETVRKVLKKQVLNKQISKVDIYYPKMIENEIKDFTKRLEKKQFIDIKRVGKYLLFETPNDYLISHLRMEGKYFVKDKQIEKGKHEHVKFTFVDNLSLRYEDVRKFGRMHLVAKDQLETYMGIAKQGIEANSDKLNAEYLYAKLKNTKLPIKSLLLDQTIISGLGNIYADEVLFESGVNPFKKGCEMSLEECTNIVINSKRIINNAIKHGGTTIRSYTSSLGVKGNYQDYLRVHTKVGKPCPICNTIIKKIKIGGRSTYYCDICQK